MHASVGAGAAAAGFGSGGWAPAGPAGTRAPASHAIARQPRTRTTLSDGPRAALFEGANRPHVDVAGLGALLRTDHPIVLHLLDHARRAVIADLEPALEVGDRGVARLGDDLERAIVHLVDVLAARLLVLRLLAQPDQRLVELGRALGAQR